MEKNHWENSLGRLQKKLSRERIRLFFSFFIPFVLVFMVYSFLDSFESTLFEARWYKEPFTIVIAAIFVFGQTAAFVQFVLFYRKNRHMHTLARILSEFPRSAATKDILTLQEKLRGMAGKSEEMLLLDKWIQMGFKKCSSLSELLSDNAVNRTALEKEKSLYLHIMINRVILKLGFLGTLIGLWLAFPAMINAIYSLEGSIGSGGESGFLVHIAEAIRGDQYAIVTTMIATVLSIMAEFLTIQIIARIHLNFEIAHSHIQDWYQEHILPIFHTLEKGGTDDLKERNEENLATLEKLSRETGRQLASLIDFQKHLAQRVEELVNYEGQYRSFLTAKKSGAAPKDLMPDDTGGEA
jgi:hypothetical protein